MTATPDFSIRMQVAGMRGLLSEIIAVGALSKHGDTDLMERVREAADTPLPELPSRSCLAQIEEPAQPIAGYRISDPSDPEIGFWLSETPCAEGYRSEPLYAGAAPAVVAPPLDVTLDEDQAGLLRDMLGDPAGYEEALTVRLIVCDGHSGHGLYVAQAEYQDEGAVLLTALPAPACSQALIDAAAPAMDFADAYAGAREELLIWKRRALEAERDLRARGAAPVAAEAMLQDDYPHEQMDAMALARYKVAPSNASMLWSHAVVAGDGAQQLYVGREVEC